MMTELIYSFESNIIRTAPHQDFVVFCLTDCLKALGSKTQPSNAKQNLIDVFGDGVVIDYPIKDSLGRTQIASFITETGLTFLASRSTTEIGKRFARWIHKEVLPSIRKTGSYSIKPLSPAELIIAQGQALLELERKQTQLQEEQIRLAVEQQVTKALAEQTNQLAVTTDSRVNALELELQTLKSILNQPIPSCKQTARQRIVEIAQLTADYLYKKGQFASMQLAIKEVWNRINLKIRNSSLKIDLAARKAYVSKQYQKALASWEQAGKPKGLKPVKKNYPHSMPALIETLSIEQPALECVVSVANELVG